MQISFECGARRLTKNVVTSKGWNFEGSSTLLICLTPCFLVCILVYMCIKKGLCLMFFFSFFNVNFRAWDSQFSGTICFTYVQSFSQKKRALNLFPTIFKRIIGSIKGAKSDELFEKNSDEWYHNGMGPYFDISEQIIRLKFISAFLSAYCCERT